jgi:hypothetical protein
MYSVRNISTTPPRPIGLMLGGAQKNGSINTKNHMLISTDNVPVFITDGQYAYAKAAIQRYEAAGMLVCQKVDADEAEEEKDKASAKERKSEILRVAKEKYGVDLEKRKGVKTLEAELAALEAEADQE